MRATKCIWKCGGQTTNASRICDDCWLNRERLREERKAEEDRRPRRQRKSRVATPLASGMAERT
ncbi:MAG: hypothetical protein UY90_C0065G0006 [Candidatus Peregrinibacteria bacterium GW2011_GWA2_54_9]|nr:MAG: hypothetical protein UY90_C0065G0006 [Candidatus Peregrinibacteria bacterium GW2011_GWA2_54_9]